MEVGLQFHMESEYGKIPDEKQASTGKILHI